MNIKKFIALAVGLTVLSGCSDDQLEPIPFNKSDRTQSLLTEDLGGQAMTTTLYRVTEKSDDSYLVAEPLDRGVKFSIVVDASKYDVGDIIMVGIDENGEIVTEEKKDIPRLQEDNN